MKKFFIIVVMILLITLIYFLGFNKITIFNWTNKTIGKIEEMDKNLKSEINEATELKNIDYPDAIEELEKSIRNLKSQKEEYERITNNLASNINIDAIKTKEYKIEKLWIAFETYAKEENVELKLDILEGNSVSASNTNSILNTSESDDSQDTSNVKKSNTSSENIYDLNITLVGEYISITDFIYDVERDDELGFKIQDFVLIPYTIVNSSADGKTQSVVYTDKLKATFSIENVAIDFN